ncbi:hydroxyethylthiazole kinase [Clostridium thermarum]|uniref:hydroxyethylthiazole kinase n=1 Tax=Clostridium thermarum TaxID=1716543 RepID=UPI0013D6E44B|nr:hydroxyethylthiazole kinase [Clostridium thermarum]
MEIIKAVCENLTLVKEQSPLVHHITNYVTVNDCANMVLALGGSPVMADDIDEVEEMVSLAGALVINVGTLNARTIESMLVAGKKANKIGVPVVLDPVGIGATALRTDTVVKLIKEVKFAVIRGNMSEIKILSGLNVEIKGVDSIADDTNGKETAVNLARKLQTVIAITGSLDVITDGEKVCIISNGEKILSKLTGTGCMSTSLVGTYLGASRNPFTAAVAGVMTMGLAGELALKSMGSNDGIGTFRAKLFDEVYKMNVETIMVGGKLQYEETGC